MLTFAYMLIYTPALNIYYVLQITYKSLLSRKTKPKMRLLKAKGEGKFYYNV